MKIYNYSDLPVVINRVSIDEREIYLHNAIPRFHITHNGNPFIPNHDTDDRNVVMYITKHPSISNPSYQYRSETFNTPPVAWYASLVVISISYLLIIKILQKLKTRS